jgi:hypothetical protein
VVAVLAALLIAAACGDTGRPELSEWEPVWESATSLMPLRTQLGDPPDREVCSRALGDLSAVVPELFPTPDIAIEGTVRDWVTIAEDAMYECPPSSAQLPDLDHAYGELARLEAEVDAVIIMEANGG